MAARAAAVAPAERAGERPRRRPELRGRDQRRRERGRARAREPAARAGGRHGGDGREPVRVQPVLVRRRRTCSRAACSIFAPDTDYELRLTLADPDGVTGEARRTLRAHTRPEPQPAAGGKTYHVYPVGYDGTEAGAVVHGADGRVLHGRRALRLSERVSAAGTARRHDPRARGRVLERSPPLHESRVRRPATSRSRPCSTAPTTSRRAARPSGRSRSRPRATARWSSTATARRTCST